MSGLAQISGFALLLFPELGALALECFRNPHGKWARSGWYLVLTPLLTAVIGTLVVRTIPFGVASVTLVVTLSLLVIRLVRSPVLPAISAGLLPVVMGEASPWYPPSLLVGLGLLALANALHRRLRAHPSPQFAPRIPSREEGAHRIQLAVYFAFLLLATSLAVHTGWRMLVFPPLVVMGYEMLVHGDRSSASGSRWILPILCTVSACLGTTLVLRFGVHPLTAAIQVTGVAFLLRRTKAQLPPVVATGLIPFAMHHPSWEYPLAVAAGSTLLAGIAWLRLGLPSYASATTRSESREPTR